MEEVNIIQAVINFITQWLPIALTVVGAFAAIATVTPNKADDRIAQVLLDIINFLGANLGKAKNDPNK